MTRSRPIKWSHVSLMHIAEFAGEDLVLELQIADVSGQFLVSRVGDQQQQPVVYVLHRCKNPEAAGESGDGFLVAPRVRPGDSPVPDRGDVLARTIAG